MKLCKKTLFSLITLVSISFFLASFLFHVPSSHALSVGGVEQEGFDSGEISSVFGQNTNQNSLYKTTARIINASLSVLGIIFLVLLVMAGYKYMTAMGNEDKVKEAITQIKNAIIGLTIVLMSYALSKYIIETLIKASLNNAPWVN